MYAIDPQNDLDKLSPTPYLLKPKSVNKQCPSLSKTTFSGFKSLNTIY